MQPVLLRFGFSLALCGAACGSSTSSSESPPPADAPDAALTPSPARDAGIDAAPTNDASAPDAAPPAASHVLLFGGSVSTEYLGDTWVWNGSAWSQAGSGPSARGYAAMAGLGGHVVLFGGTNGKPLGDTWEWDGTAWTERNVGGPPARSFAAFAAYGNKLVLHGGMDAAYTPLSDTWEWDGNAWTERTVTGAPACARCSLGALDGVLLLGATGTGETWQWDSTAWTLLASNTDSRSDAQLATLGGKLYEVGGTNGGGCSYDVHQWTGTTWQEVNALPVRPRCLVAGSAAALPDRLVIFGGAGYPDGLPAGYEYLDDTWEWNGTWTQRQVSGPAARERQMMAAY